MFWDVIRPVCESGVGYKTCVRYWVVCWIGRSSLALSRGRGVPYGMLAISRILSIFVGRLGFTDRNAGGKSKCLPPVLKGIRQLAIDLRFLLRQVIHFTRIRIQVVKFK